MGIRWLRLSQAGRSSAAALGMGLVVFPLAKLLYVPNYVLNFLATLVHEIGHCLLAWAVGCPSIPAVSLAGGGVTVWGQQSILLAALIWIGLGVAAFRWKNRPGGRLALGAAFVLYPLAAFTRAHALLPTAGGVLLEIMGGTACFYVCLRSTPPRRPLERPLYALWGWWMVLNRAGEALLMLRDRRFWDERAIIESGLAAGMTNDLEVLRAEMNVSPAAILWGVLILCLASLPAAVLAARWSRAEGSTSLENGVAS